MSWMEARRIRRVRKPTPWEQWVARWHAWFEDALERTVCCGVDPASLAEADAMRMSIGSKQASSVFSIRSMSAYMDDSEFGDYEDDQELLSDTESESSDDHHITSASRSSIDMEARHSLVDCEEIFERRASVGSAYIPFDDEEEAAEHHDQRSVTTHVTTTDTQQDERHRTQVQEDRLYHRALFNCVLVELLSTQHPVVWWT